MKLDKIIQIIDAASILTEFGIIRFDFVLAGRSLMSTYAEFSRSVNMLSEISEKVSYNLDYKGEGPPKIEPLMTYAELERIGLFLEKAFRPENLSLLREVLKSDNPQANKNTKEICHRLDCSPEKLANFFVHPEYVVSYYDKGLGIMVNTGKTVSNPRAGVVCLDKQFWYKLSSIAYKYRHKKYHPEASNIAVLAQEILNDVRQKVEDQFTTAVAEKI